MAEPWTGRGGEPMPADEALLRQVLRELEAANAKMDEAAKRHEERAQIDEQVRANVARLDQVETLANRLQRRRTGYRTGSRFCSADRWDAAAETLNVGRSGDGSDGMSRKQLAAIAAGAITALTIFGTIVLEVVRWALAKAGLGS